MRRQPIRFGGPKKTSTSTTKTGTLIPVEVHSFSLDGRGVGKSNGKTVFVRGALPGEQVEASVTNSRKRFDEADVTQIIEASPERIEPICAHYNECGGCDLQHLAHQAQVALKERTILEQLARHAGITPKRVESALSDQAQGYRRSARIGINVRSSGELIIGFRRRNSNKLVNIDNCPVLEPRLNSAIQALRTELEALPESLKSITHIDCSTGDDALLITLRITRNLPTAITSVLSEFAEYNKLTLALEDNNGNVQFLHQANALEYQLPAQDGAVTLSFNPGDFLQVNAQLNQAMVKQACEWLAPTENDHVLDLFCGLGNFTLPLAKTSASVTGVEGSKKMVDRASANAAANAIANADFFCADLSEPILNAPWFNQRHARKPDLILLDPPRTGAFEIIKTLADTRARKILYIACNPSSLVRDAQVLTEAGYKMTRFGVIDMFAQTSHIESMALFERVK